MDRRSFWSQASEAEIAEACRLKRLRRVEPSTERVIAMIADLAIAPRDGRERQLLRGEGFTIRAADEETGWLWGETETDRYSGWIDGSCLCNHPPGAPTHRVAAAQTYAKSNSGLKTCGHVTPLSMGSALVVLDASEGWSRVAWTRGNMDQDLFVPSVHLAPIDLTEPDPASVAARLIGTPYLWGGNSSFGIDCSGLVQIACVACGIPCPGDSDLQEAALGTTVPEGTAPRRGDLLFWKGHVAWVLDPGTILHANAHAMAVTLEPLHGAIDRNRGSGRRAGDAARAVAGTRHARVT